MSFWQILVFEILAGVLALCDQVLVVTEEFEEIHRNIQDGDFFRAEDKDEILALAVKARHVRDALPPPRSNVVAIRLHLIKMYKRAGKTNGRTTTGSPCQDTRARNA